MLVHRGIPRQRGRGLVGRWMPPFVHTPLSIQRGRGFKDLAKAALRTMGPKVLQTAYNVGMDMLSGKRKLKDSLLSRGKELAVNTIKSVPGIVRNARVQKTADALQNFQRRMRNVMVNRR